MGISLGYQPIPNAGLERILRLLVATHEAEPTPPVVATPKFGEIPTMAKPVDMVGIMDSTRAVDDCLPHWLTVEPTTRPEYMVLGVPSHGRFPSGVGRC